METACLTQKQEEVLVALEAYCRSYMADAWIGTWKEVMEMEADLDLLTHLEERGYIAPFRQMSGGFWWICPTRAHGEERDAREASHEEKKQERCIHHSLIKDLEDVSAHIANHTRSLASGKLSESSVLLTIKEMEGLAQQLNKTLKKMQLAMQGNDAWQRGL